ncbi:MAG: Rieske 2Fe-2S domain-containing protein [Myxococcales bacterium]|nr:Rieske 2Fe-2S domain-containing protein [Myxococcales bacterium]
MPRFYLGTDDLQPGEQRIVYLPDLPPPWRSILVARTEHKCVAYWNVCRHLPVPLDAGSGDLGPGPDWMCQTHGARFRVVDGACVSGPCAGQKLFTLSVYCEEEKMWAEGEIPEG